MPNNKKGSKRYVCNKLSNIFNDYSVKGDDSNAKQRIGAEIGVLKLKMAKVNVSERRVYQYALKDLELAKKLIK